MSIELYTNRTLIAVHRALDGTHTHAHARARAGTHIQTHTVKRGTTRTTNDADHHSAFAALLRVGTRVHGAGMGPQHPTCPPTHTSTTL